MSTPPESSGVGFQCLRCGSYRHESHPATCTDLNDRSTHPAHDWDELRCIEDPDAGAGCTGPVEYRFGYGLKGSYARCAGHFDTYMDRMEEINRRYPDSPIPPADFDPTFAGERWNEDD